MNAIDEMRAIDEMHAERAQKGQAFLNQRIAHFLQRYRPEDEHDARRFEEDLLGLILTTRMQAVEPFARQLGNAMALHPIFPLLSGK